MKTDEFFIADGLTDVYIYYMVGLILQSLSFHKIKSEGCKANQ